MRGESPDAQGSPHASAGVAASPRARSGAHRGREPQQFIIIPILPAVQRAENASRGIFDETPQRHARRRPRRLPIGRKLRSGSNGDAHSARIRSSPAGTTSVSRTHPAGGRRKLPAIPAKCEPKGPALACESFMSTDELNATRLPVEDVARPARLPPGAGFGRRTPPHPKTPSHPQDGPAVLGIEGVPSPKPPGKHGVSEGFRAAGLAGAPLAERFRRRGALESHPGGRRFESG